MTTATSDDTTCARIAQRLAQRVGAHRYRVWFDRSARMDFQDEQNTLVVAVPNRFVADWIGRNFQDDLISAASTEAGRPVLLDVQIDPQSFTHTLSSPESRHATTKGFPAGGGATGQRFVERTLAAPSAGPENTLRLRYRLEEFVVGPSNELAFAAAARLADDEEAANPLFIHGGVGLGKTHLLQGICRRVLENRPEARVLYTTGEQFTNEFLTAIRTNRLESFRKKIRRLDLLAVDDVHFIANKEKTQQEFLHSFNAIELGGARVVLASDCHPKLTEQFSEALISRCVRGMVVEVRPPDTLTRMKIVRALAQRRGIPLMETVVGTLAARCQGSVRDIEGALTKLHALARLSQPMTPAQQMMAAAADLDGAATPMPVGDIGSPQEPSGTTAFALGLALVSPDLPADAPNSVGSRPMLATTANGPMIGHALVTRLFDAERESPRAQALRFESILKVVAERFGLNPGRLMMPGRQRQMILARSLVIHLARTLTPLSFPEIARALGKASHSTVINAEQRLRVQLAENAVVHVPQPNNHWDAAISSSPLDSAAVDDIVPLSDLIEQLKAAALKA